MIEKCAQCGKEIDLKKEASSKCDKCHKVFCCCLWTECFDEHRIDCDGRHGTILSPGFMVNLLPLKKS